MRKLTKKEWLLIGLLPAVLILIRIPYKFAGNDDQRHAIDIGIMTILTLVFLVSIVVNRKKFRR